MDPLEVVAAAFGVVSVWLSTREHIASWPTAIVNVSLYFVFFRRERYYADMGLQVVYFALSWYGWYEWKFGGANRTELPVTRTTRSQALVLVPMGLAGAVALGFVLDRTTDAVLPWVDSAASVASLIAQWMMTRKLLENWRLWVVIDVVYVSMFLIRGHHPTALLYGIFLVLAVLGDRRWGRSLAAREAAAAGTRPT